MWKPYIYSVASLSLVSMISRRLIDRSICVRANTPTHSVVVVLQQQSAIILLVIVPATIIGEHLLLAEGRQAIVIVGDPLDAESTLTVVATVASGTNPIATVTTWLLRMHLMLLQPTTRTEAEGEGNTWL